MTDDQPAAIDFDARYEEVRGQAAAVNHELRVIVAPGKVTSGQDFTLKPFEAEALALAPALDRIAEYLASPKAAARGELYRKRDAAAAAAAEALAAWGRARRAAEEDLDAELDADATAAVDDKPLTVRAGVLRSALDHDDPESAATLDRIKDLPDDALVDVTPEVDG